jgi:tetrahydromethanopterin S-methyltransferase subunit G
MPGVIFPRKTVNELRKRLDEVTGNVGVALSEGSSETRRPAAAVPATWSQ